MNRSIKHVNVFMDGQFIPADIHLEGDRIQSIITANIPAQDSCLYAMPGFADVHVHLREPGFSHKETIRTLSLIHI